MKKGMTFWFWVTMFSFLLVAASLTSYAQTGEVLRVAFTTDARTFDPAIVTRDYTGYAVIGGLYDFLVQYDLKPNKDGTFTTDTTKFVPMLAERWEHSSDMSEWTFYLRKDVKFHSGKPLNAQAVKYTFARYIKIKSAANTVLGLAKVTEQGMEVPDDIFFLKTPKEQPQQQERKGEDDLINLDARPFPDSIDGIDGYVSHPEMVHI